MTHPQPLHHSARKILVVGNGGTGKSTLSAALSTQLNIPVWHLDQIGWAEGWQRVPEQEFRTRLHSIMQQSHWIIDGWSYHSTMQERCDAADLIIFLDYPFMSALYGALKRWIQFYHRRNPFDPPHTRRGNVLALTIRAMWRVRREYVPDLRRILSAYSSQKVVCLHSRKELSSWLNSHDLGAN